MNKNFDPAKIVGSGELSKDIIFASKCFFAQLIHSMIFQLKNPLISESEREFLKRNILTNSRVASLHFGEEETERMLKKLGISILINNHTVILD